MPPPDPPVKPAPSTTIVTETKPDGTVTTTTTTPHAPVAAPMAQQFLPESIGGFNEQCLLFQMAGGIMKGLKSSGTWMKDANIFAYSRGAPGSAKTYDDNVMNLEDFAADFNSALTAGTSGTDLNYLFVKYLTLAHNKKLRNFLELRSADATQLVPDIAISIEYVDDNGKKNPRSFTLDFPNHTDLAGLQAKSALRPARKGAGILEINVRHEGIDTATDKFVLVDSKFLFQDFRTLTQGMGNAKSLNKSYGKLLELGNHTSIGSGKGLKRLHKYTVFDFGYNSNDKISGRLGLPKLRTKIKAELFKYTFDFKEDGSIILNTTHRGTMHTVFGSKPWANILSYAREEEARIREQGAISIADAKNRLKQSNDDSLEQRTLERLAIRTLMDLMEDGMQGDQTGGMHRSTFNRDTTAVTSFKSSAAAGQHDSSTTFNKGIASATIDFEQINETNIEAALEASLNLPDVKVGPGGLDKSSLTKVTNYALHILKEAWKSTQGGDRKSWTEATIPYQTPGKGEGDYLALLGAIENFRRAANKTSDVVENNLDPGVITKNAQAAVAAQMALLRYISLQKIGEAIKSANAVYYGGITEAQRINLVTWKGGKKIGTLFDSGAKDAITPSSFMTEAKNLVGGTSAAKNNLGHPNTHAIPFVFLGEFLEAILRLPFSAKPPLMTFHDGMKAKTGIDLQVALGTCNFDPPYTGAGVNNKYRIKEFPLYYLPLSLNKVNEFITREIIGKEKTAYSFGDFMTQLFQKYITPFFNSCTRVSAQGTRLLIPKFDFAFGFNKQVLGSNKNGKDTFFVYDTKTFKDGWKRNFGSYKKNLDDLIPHFYLGGPDGGIATNIKLQDIADQTLKTAVFYGQAPAGDESHHGAADPKRAGWAPTVFQANIDTLGYPLFKLGHMVFVDARNVIPKKHSRVFEATGYYAIKTISHKLTPNSFTTSIFGINAYSQATFEGEKLAKTGGKAGKSAKSPASKAKPSGTNDEPVDPDADAEEAHAAPGTGDETSATEGETAKNITDINKALDKTRVKVMERYEFIDWKGKMTYWKPGKAGTTTNPKIAGAGVADDKGNLIEWGGAQYTDVDVIWNYNLDFQVRLGPFGGTAKEHFESIEGIPCRVTKDKGIGYGSGEKIPGTNKIDPAGQQIHYWGYGVIPYAYAQLVYEGKIVGDPYEGFIKQEMGKIIADVKAGKGKTTYAGGLTPPPASKHAGYKYHPAGSGKDNPDWDWD